jgi:hypothetical protein
MHKERDGRGVTKMEGSLAVARGILYMISNGSLAYGL